MKVPLRSLALSATEMRELSAVALGESKADLVLRGGNLVDVYSGEILPGYSVAVKGRRIAWVGADPAGVIGPETEVVDVSGKFLTPGFIDAHTHLIWYHAPHEFLRYAIGGGTTCIITETLEIAFPLGYRGVREFLKSVRDQPIKIFATAPTMVSANPCLSRLIGPRELERLFREEEVIGLGEGYWQAVRGNERLLELFALTLSSGRRVEGHAAGARGNRLLSYIACGVSSCHEPINAEEVLERLRQGLHVMVREGSVRRELEAVAPIRESGADLRRVSLVSDGLEPGDVLRDGYMEAVARRAVALGFDPVRVVQMLTLNPAEHFRLDDLIGGIAPGKFADIVVFPDLKEFRAELVLSDGRVIAREGRPVVPPRKHVFPRWTRRLRLPRFGPEDFALKASSHRVRVRVIEMVTQLVTRESEVEVEAPDGYIRPDISRDILKVASIDRADRPGRKAIGLVRGFGLKRGAFASTFAWDCPDIILVGADEADMALAVNRIVEMGGGAVVCAGGEVLAEVPLPIGGVISDLPLEDLAAGLEELQRKASQLGVPFPNAHLALTVLTTAAIPFLRITSEGLINLRENRLVGLEVS